jgi:predicted NUDIX family NTP pyrophosphohydrolase
MSVTLDVTAASDAVTTVTVGDATNGAASYMAATENDPETVGIYIADGRLANGGAARQATATVATAGTVGSATCIITFRHA